jgi:hypothetical protein
MANSMLMSHEWYVAPDARLRVKDKFRAARWGRGMCPAARGIARRHRRRRHLLHGPGAAVSGWVDNRGRARTSRGVGGGDRRRTWFSCMCAMV